MAKGGRMAVTPRAYAVYFFIVRLQFSAITAQFLPKCAHGVFAIVSKSFQSIVKPVVMSAYHLL
jgi:hypothetical protein